MRADSTSKERTNQELFHIRTTPSHTLDGFSKSLARNITISTGVYWSGGEVEPLI
jgi:hypothetical protein